MSWFRSKWVWLAICVVVSSVAFMVQSVLGVRLAIEIGNAFSSGIKDGLRDGGFPGPPKKVMRISVSFLFGLIEIKDTPNPYLWAAIGGSVTGALFGLVVWGLFQIGLFLFKRKRPASEGIGAE